MTVIAKWCSTACYFQPFSEFCYHHDMTEGDVVRVKHKRNHYFFQVLFGDMADNQLSPRFQKYTPLSFLKLTESLNVLKRYRQKKNCKQPHESVEFIKQTNKQKTKVEFGIDKLSKLNIL